MKRSGSRFFTDTQRRNIYIKADGRCEKCGGVLSKGWNAHHIISWSQGGLTEFYNGMALCENCHKKMHGRFNMVDPRGWQVDAIEDFKMHDGDCFLIDATPGAGKTFFSGFCAQETIEKTDNVFVIIVVPITSIKNDFVRAYHQLGINLTSVLKNTEYCPKDFDGGVVTYHQLPNIISTFEIWSRNGKNLFFVFDEIHHASEENKWGYAAECCGRMASKIVAMTGTPFRGDGRRISFLKYDNKGIVIPDSTYTYKQAVSENVCREVIFHHDDGVAEYCRVEHDRDVDESVRISESCSYNVSKVVSTVFNPTDWVKAVLLKADEKLDEYRKTFPGAGGIVVCRPGSDDKDTRHINAIANELKCVLNETPTIVTYDDKESDGKIERFRRSNDKWIVAVRKVSEGVDIKRLRVMVLLSYPTTELLFRQLVGRVVRVEQKKIPENATVIMAKFPKLVEFASRITEEAEQGLKDREDKKTDGGNAPQKVLFMPKNASHEHGGLTSMYGEQFNINEIIFSENLKKNDPTLSSASTAVILHTLRKAGFNFPSCKESETPTRHEVKTEKRKKISKLSKRLAYVEARNGLKPDFKGISMRLSHAIGVNNINDLTDNHGVDVMDLAIRKLESWIVEAQRS